MMKRKLISTEDGSPTFFVPEIGEHFHSIHGAKTESDHIFIKAALNHCNKKEVRVLEYGMGTGLNILLTYFQSELTGRKVYYHSIEKFPLSQEEYESMKKFEWTASELAILNLIHDSQWDVTSKVSENFLLHKEKNDFRIAKPAGLFDVIYFDAFSPEVQPELWTREIFESLFRLSAPGAILTTYSSKGTVRRELKAAGFTVEKLPGPPGKREFLRALRS